ncbi:type IV secretion system DNA-binding domain-containing protein [Streptomyces sp. NBC_00237]|uniref:type IV secretory system conjugative DNA transfer family protein n=1 Tax=Streptomyces sp. NBC_00237 TaxID=2975687 RepID=UPI00225A7A26|nr:type IV secretion system DNA-binding domain-containing protein [Streptomyces sp. NBC_00237]MCX5206916.1 type IV secretion system DNA-binding domain-containing protein [Streptomyces sp. NBC_00237]
MSAGGPLGHFLTDPGAFWTALVDGGIGLVAGTWPWLAPVIASGAGGAALVHGKVRAHRQQAFADGAQLVTILAPPTVSPKGGEVLWAQLSGLLRPWHQRLLHGQPHLGFEYAWNTHGLTVRMWLPGTLPTALVRRAVEAAWPGAHTTLTTATKPFPATYTCTAGVLRLARPEVLPLRTDHKEDPLRPLLQAATGMADGEHALVQIVARPATGARLRRARHSARRHKAGHTGPRLSALFRLFAHAPQRTAPAPADPSHGAEVRQGVGKLTGPQWDVQIRYAVACPSKPPGGEARLRGRAHALASAFALYAARNWLARHRLRTPQPLLSGRHFTGRGDLLSVPELAALAHLPADADAPGLARAGARSVAPPPGVPQPGPGVKPLGHADTGTRRPVGLAVADARQHLHLMGATGSGKSTLIAHLVLDDVAHGRGAIVVDPKGDLITDLLHRLPASCADRLVVIDPDDVHTPPCLNVLDGDDIDVVVDNITGIFRRIFTAFWGPRTDDIMRAACLTLLRHAQATNRLVTLADIPRLLGESAYRIRMIPTIKDPVLRGFWTWYESLSEPSRAAVVGPIMNKLRAFLLRSFARQAIASGESTFHLPDVLDGGILLARLPKGALGEETTRLLGSFIVAKTWQAASARARTPEKDRIDASLYVDEAHNFLTLPYPLEDMLAEARGYRLAMKLAHQHLAQLPRDLREGISANARNKVFFNTSPEDANALERHTLPTLGAHDLSHLGPYQAAAHLLADGAETSAFTLTTQPLPPAIPGRSTELRAAAARRVGGTTSRSAYLPL